MNRAQHILLTLVAPPGLADDIVDWLLVNHHGGYFSYQGAGHGESAAEMSIAEQVAGRQQKAVFMLHLQADDYETLLSDFGQTFAGAGIHYWASPVLAAGHL